MRVLALIPVAVFLALFLALPATAQDGFTYQLYMTTEEQDGQEILAFAPGDTLGTKTFSPLLGGLIEQVGPTSYSWTTTQPWPVDVVVQGNTMATLYFGTGVEVLGTTSVALRTVEGTTATPIGQATSDGLLEVLELTGHTETFTMDTDGAILRAGSFLRFDVSISGLELDVLASIDYGDATATSGIDGLTVTILDSDGDGYGDTAERQAGTDPMSALDYPGAPPPWDLDDDGLNDTWEDDALGDRNQTGSDDPDGDGCDNACEFEAGTDPLVPDTDADGRLDGQELDEGTDPLTADPAEEPEGDEEELDTPEPWLATILFAANVGIVGIALFGRFT